jgi:hypothetical protein
MQGVVPTLKLYAGSPYGNYIVTILIELQSQATLIMWGAAEAAIALDIYPRIYYTFHFYRILIGRSYKKYYNFVV